MEYTYKVTTIFSGTLPYWKGRKRTVYGTLNRAVAIYKANVPRHAVEVERAPVGEYEVFDMQAHMESNNAKEKRDL